MASLNLVITFIVDSNNKNNIYVSNILCIHIIYNVAVYNNHNSNNNIVSQFGR